MHSGAGEMSGSRSKRKKFSEKKVEHLRRKLRGEIKRNEIVSNHGGKIADKKIPRRGSIFSEQAEMLRGA